MSKNDEKPERETLELPSKDKLGERDTQNVVFHLATINHNLLRIADAFEYLVGVIKEERGSG